MKARGAGFAGALDPSEPDLATQVLNVRGRVQAVRAIPRWLIEAVSDGSVRETV